MAAVVPLWRHVEAVDSGGNSSPRSAWRRQPLLSGGARRSDPAAPISDGSRTVREGQIQTVSFTGDLRSARRGQIRATPILRCLTGAAPFFGGSRAARGHRIWPPPLRRLVGGSFSSGSWAAPSLAARGRHPLWWLAGGTNRAVRLYFFCFLN